jgi:subtilase family serine protease
MEFLVSASPLAHRIAASLLLGLASLASGAAVADGTASGIIVRFHTPAAGMHSMTGFELKPQSNFENLPDNTTPTMHTHLRVFIPTDGSSTAPVSPAQAQKNLQALHAPVRGIAPRGRTVPLTGGGLIGYNTPSSLACIYDLVAQPGGQPAGCDPNYTTVNASGGGGAIAVVDAYHYPTAAADLAYFSTYFGLPRANIRVVHTGNSAPLTPPSGQESWNTEAALDLQWAHALAPYAALILVEANDASTTSMYAAVNAAKTLVHQLGGGVVSMSFGAGEYASEINDDSTFSSAPPDVVFIASSGDTDSTVQYPAASPYVIGVGGSTINRDGSNVFTGETAWSDSGGGLSAYESAPSFQTGISAVQTIVGSTRGTPDISMLADPATGVGVYVNGSWNVVGGTSLAAPIAAAVIDAGEYAASNFTDTATKIATLYANGSTATDARDVPSGSCGGNSAAAGYDLCTGYGSLISYIDSGSSFSIVGCGFSSTTIAGLRSNAYCPRASSPAHPLRPR